jgi:hypothetical protein
MAVLWITGHWTGRALVEAEFHFPAVAQTVGFALGRLKMLELSMRIDCHSLRHATVFLFRDAYALPLSSRMRRRNLFFLHGRLGKRRSCAGKFACKIQNRLLAPLKETLAVDVFGLVLAPSFLRVNYSIPSFGNREIRPERLPPPYQQKYQQNDRLHRRFRELLLMFSNAPPKFS